MFLDIDSAGRRQAIRLHSLISRGMHLGPLFTPLKERNILASTTTGQHDDLSGGHEEANVQNGPHARVERLLELMATSIPSGI
jgi:hypothetical protein